MTPYNNSSSAATLGSSKTLLHQETGSTNQSPSGTVFYSLEEEEDNTIEATTSTSTNKRSNETLVLSRKKSKLEQGVHEGSTSINHLPLKSLEDFKVEEPNWQQHPKAWGFLQSQNPNFQSLYLEKRDFNATRPGYVLGRRDDCDLVFPFSEISKAHCLIYMETGANQNQKGIRIFIKDTSFNGTYVEGKLVGQQNRILLKNGNKIQLIKPPSDAANETISNKFFKILFPASYEANTCETVYKLTRHLGKGNFAHVSHAINRQTNEEVAIKVLNKARYERKPKMLEAVIEEITIMMRLRHHPLLVKMKNIYNELKRIYLVLEYVPGGELFHYVVENQKLDEDTSRFIFWQLLKAIEFVHDEGIAHRDLKPENVLLVNRETLQIKMSDFGLAKTKYRDKAFDSQCGTPNYVAPEILDSSESRAYDTRCDLWSLGVILYICLCGYPPFSEENAPPSMKTQIKTGLFSFASPYWDNISKEAKDLIRKLLTVEPENRITVNEALEHDWLHMNKSHMDRMKEGLGADVLDAIRDLTPSNKYSETQANVNYSQQL